MQKPGAFGPFKFLWKMKLEHEPNAPAALTQPILLDRLIGFRGFKSIAFVGTASETVHAVDVDFGVPLWKYHINYSASPPPVAWHCRRVPGRLDGGAVPADGRSRRRRSAAVAAVAGAAAVRAAASVSPARVRSRWRQRGRGVAARAAARRPWRRGAGRAAPGTVPGSAAAAAGARRRAAPGGRGRWGGRGGPFVGRRRRRLRGRQRRLPARAERAERVGEHDAGAVPAGEHARGGPDRRDRGGRRGGRLRRDDARVRQPAGRRLGDGSRRARRRP